MRTKQRPFHSEQLRGASLLEILISSIVLFIATSVALSTFLWSDRAVGDSLAISDTASRANRLEQFLTLELKGAQIDTLADTATSPQGRFMSMTYRQPVSPPFSAYDFATGAVAMGPLRKLMFVYDSGEAGTGSGDNADNDGDGLIDEGSLVLFQDANADDIIQGSERVAIVAVGLSSDQETYQYTAANGSSVTIARGVDFGFSLLPSGAAAPLSTDERLSINLSLLTRLFSQGAMHAQDRDVVLALRN